MIEIFKLATSGFWQFVGVLILFYLPIQFALSVIHKCIRAITINKHGYPPPHCDGDGDAYAKSEKL